MSERPPTLPAEPPVRRDWRFGLRGRMWTTFGIVATVVLAATAQIAQLEGHRFPLLALEVGGALAALAAAFFYFAQEVLGRISRLGAAMRDIAHGDTQPDIDTESRDEIGDMGRELSVFRDAMAELNRLATHDILTGLGNRAMLDAYVTRQIAAKRSGAVFFFHLEGYREINETFGHATGDQVLCRLAERLEASIRPGDVAARVGGERFVVAAADLPGGDAAAQAFCRRLEEELRRPIRFEELDLEVVPAVGIARYPQHGVAAETLLHRADMALHAGRDEACIPGGTIYTEEIGEHAERRKDIRRDLKLAIERGDFFLHFQPKMRIATGRIEGVETLVRWNHPERGAISPVDFIPLAEASGLILPLGRWVLRESCRRVQAWAAAGIADLRVAVNISPVQFQRDDMVGLVRQTLAETGLPPERLELEITEGVLLHHEEGVARRLAALRDMGVHLAIDDFGTGYSSLSYLKTLAVHTLKIDQSFVRNMEPGNEDARICKAIIGLAHDIGLEVVAEGIEWQQQIDFLNAEACDLGQGYYISRPLAADAFVEFLGAWRAERLQLREITAS